MRAVANAKNNPVAVSDVSESSHSNRDAKKMNRSVSTI